MACVTEETLAAHFELTLTPEESAAVLAHIDGCDACAQLFADCGRAFSRSLGSARGVEASADDKTLLAMAERLQHGIADTTPQLGRYRLERILGVGGMGVVYAAHDPELDRKVAIKLLRPDPRTPAEVSRARMTREAQAMARLSHPNVIDVYEIGSIGEKVFVVMELIDGVTVAEWLRQKSRTWREIVRVFVAAGEGLAAAHRAGIVHRDFKPDNVLISTSDRICVTDFGLARIDATEVADASLPSPSSLRPIDPSLTYSGRLIGTPAYMAPEQMSGASTSTAADVFSFCVALYEALYRVRPFAGKTVEELRAAIALGKLQPPAPMTGPSQHRAAIERGLQADPRARPATMDELLATLRVDPFARRRRRLMSAAALLVLAAVATAFVQQRRHSQLCRGAEQKLAGTWDPTVRARLHDAFLATKVPYAEPVWQSVANTLDDYTRRWTAMHTQACEDTRLRGEQSEAVMELKIECLDRQRNAMKALVDVLEHGDAHVVERAVQATQGLSSLDECRNADALRQVVPEPVDAQPRARVAAARAQVASLEAQFQAGRYEPASKLAGTALTAARETGYAPVIAEALYWRGRCEEARGNAQAAADTQFSAASTSEEARYDHQRARSFVSLVFVLGVQLARYPEAKWCADLGRAAIARAGGDPVLEANLDAYQALLLSQQAHYADAVALLKHATQRFEQLLGPGDARVETALHNLAIIYGQKGDFDEELATDQRSLAMTQKIYGPNHPVTASSWDALGGAWSDKQDNDAAVKAFTKALEIREATLGPEHPLVGVTLKSLGATLIRAGQLDQAQATLERAQKILLARLGPNHPELANAEENLASLYLRIGKLDVALAHAERLLAIREKALVHDHPQVATALTMVARVHVARREPKTAFEPVERALAILEHNPNDPQYLAEARFVLACALWDSGRDRPRARTLALAARKDIVDYRADVAAWLAAHG